jgi:hypothetical protein
MEEIHERSDAGLQDACVVFQEDLDMIQACEQMCLPGAKRMLVPTVHCVLLSLLNVLFGGESMHAFPRVLCSNVGLMEFVGFNAP